MMYRKIDLSNPIAQYFIGLFLNLFFLIIIYSFDISYYNTQVPKGEFQNNIWQCSDVLTYVDPAINFVNNGVFGKGDVPDHVRTIGYPAIISFFYYFFGENWLLALQIFQAIIFALIYPVIASTIRIILPGSNSKFITSVFLLLTITGAYFTRTLNVLTDTIFILLFITGFYFGLKTYISNKVKYALLYLLIITITALIRPTLGLFPILNIAMAYWIARKYNYQIRRILLQSVGISVILLVLINISTIRNYINYSFSSPSSVIGVNAFQYLTKKVLVMEHKQKEFNYFSQQIDSINDITAKTKLRKEIMFQTVVQYPVSTIKVIAINSINVFLSNNLLSSIGNYFGFEWKMNKSSCYPYKISKLLHYATYGFMFLYAVLWSLFFLKLIYLFKNKDYETLFMVILLFIMFIVPAVLTGDGGGRFRLPFEHILFMYGLSFLFEKYDTIISSPKSNI